MADTARFERAVGIAACLCGIHCLLTPVLVATVPFLALSETVEWVVMLGSVFVGLGLVMVGPHGNRGLVLAGLGVGATVWVASLLGWFEPLPETVTSAAGSLLFAGSLLWSAQTCRTEHSSSRE